MLVLAPFIPFVVTIYDIDYNELSSRTLLARSWQEAEERAPKMVWLWAQENEIQDYNYGLEEG